MRKSRLLVPLVAALVLLTAALAFGQGQTGKMLGTVKDANGGLLPGVTVSISSASLIGGPKVTQTGPDGSFAFANLDPGLYDVRFALDGFRPVEMKDVRVSLDRATELLPKLTAGVSETITVTSDLPVVDTTRAGESQVYTTEYLDRASIGSGGRAYQSVIGRAAGAVDDGGNPHVFGSTLGENAFYIDGVDTTDPVTSTFGTNFNFDAIKEISFQTAGFDAEFGRATGGVVNIITKSGGNDFSGTFDTRYSDTSFHENGKHFNRNANKTEFLQPAATLGGPVLRDKLWFFLSAEDINDKSTPTSALFTRQFKGQDYLAKLTFQVDPSWRLVGKYSADPATITGSNASRFVLPEAESEQKQPGKVYQAEVSGVITPKLLIEVQAAANRADLNTFPQSGDLSTPGVIDQATGIESVNYFNAQFSKRDRDEFQASLTNFVDQFAGSHEFKVGGNYSNMKFSAKNNFTGGAEYLDFNGPLDPNAQLQIQTPLDFAQFTGKLYTGYAQDAWRVLPQLTFRLGVRYDDVKFKNDGGVQIADLKKVQPRVGFAYDVSGDAKTVVRGSYGIFMHPSALTLPSFTRVHSSPVFNYAPCSAFFSSAAACQAFNPAGYLAHDPLGRDPEGYTLNFVTGSSPEIIQPGLKPLSTDEFTIGVERQIFNRTSLELSYIHKKANNIFEDTCSENVPTPTPDPTLANCNAFEVANLPQAQRKYDGALLRFNSRATEWLNLIGSYVYSKSQGSVEYTQNAGADFDVFPTFYINRFGYLSDDRRHRVRLDGYVRLPLDFSLGIQSNYSSPFAYSKTRPAIYDVLYLAPRGAFRANSNYNLNLEIRKGFTLGPVRTELIGTILNVIGQEQIIAVCENSAGCGAGGAIPFGGATAFSVPRNYEVGVRFEF